MNYYFSHRSFSRLEGVDYRLVALASYALATSPIDFSITEGLRTKERQLVLYQEGKSKTLKSKHLEGRAIDVYPSGATWDIKDPKWKLLIDHFKECAKHLKIECNFGMDWGWDSPHIELK